MRRLMVPVCALVPLLCGCSSSDDTSGSASAEDSGSPFPAASPSDWTMLGYDPGSTYHNVRETRITVESAKHLRVAHQFDIGTNVYTAPVMVGDRAYVGGLAIICFDLTTGEKCWENDAFGEATASLAYADGRLFVHHSDAIVRAYDADTGELLWEGPEPAQENAIGMSSPILGGDLVVIGGSTGDEIQQDPPSFRGHLRALDQATGGEIWTSFTVGEGETGASLWSSVSFDVDAGKVYAGTGNNYTEPATTTSDAIIEFAMADGAMGWAAQRYEGDIWSIATASLGNPDFDFGANPIVFEAEVDGVMTPLIAAGQKSGDAHVIRREDGEVLWTRNLSPGFATGAAGIFNNGAWTGKYLLWAGNGAESDAPGSEEQVSDVNPAVLYAIEPATGDIAWERQLSGIVMGPITVAGGVGFVGADQQLQAFDVETGDVLYRLDVEGTIACAPTVANGRVAFGSGLGWLFGTTGSTLTILDVP